MKLWLKIVACTIPSAAFLLLSIFLLRLRRMRLRQQQLISPQTPNPPIKSKLDTLQSGFNKLHLPYKSTGSARNSLRFHHLNHHQHNQAVMPSSPFDIPRAPSSPLWAFCPSCDGGVQQNSSEFMQTVRLNPGLKKSSEDPSFSFVTTSLPLPRSTNGSFPQEAYFEITILYLQQRKKLQETGSRLIRGNSVSTSAPIMFASQEPTSCVERRRPGDLVVALGLINRAYMPNQSMPGTFPGSIGFQSDGSVFLDGRKLVFESEKAEWADVNRVIGCGYAPRKKKVFFTVDSQIVHVIRCSSEVFSSPLYPVMAADADAMILVNLGQAPFKYAPANVTRRQNPSFLRLTSGGRPPPPANSIESREMSSSASRVETEWAEHGKRSKNQSNYYSSSSKKSNGYLDDGIDAEADLFEISLQR